MLTRDVITDAFRKIGVAADDEDLTADQIAAGQRALFRLLRAWQNKGLNLWTATDLTISLTTSAYYAVSPRPVQATSCRLSVSGLDMPMQELTREEYLDLPQKLSTGTPTCWYFDKQASTAMVYVWPVLASATGQQIKLSVHAAIEEGDLSEDIDVPDEFLDAVVYGLADRLSDDYTIDVPKVTARAQVLFDEAMAMDREGSIWFGEVLN